MADDLKVAEIPDAVLDEITDRLMNSTVVLNRVTGEGPDLLPEPIGTGTCVSIQNRTCILTAGHVWDKVRKGGTTMFALSASTFAGSVPTKKIEAVSPRQIWDGKESKEGPDLALLEIPDPYASSIAAKKVLVNLARHKARAGKELRQTRQRAWAVVGMVGSLSGDLQRDYSARRVDVRIEVRAFVGGGVQRPAAQDGYDYIEIIADTSLPGVPKCFGGCSGGGLWELGAMRDEAGVITWDQDPQFWGVAFWAEKISPEQARIRCHGPKSVFEKAWSEWKLP